MASPTTARVALALLTVVATAGLVACSSGSSGKTSSPGSTSGGASGSSSAGGGGASSASAGSGGTKDPCSLASADDVTAAFGGTVAAGVADPNNSSGPTCTFAVTAASFGVDCSVIVDVPSFPSNRDEFNQNENLGGAPETVDGIGDAAYKPEQGSPYVQFIKGATVVDVRLKCTSDPDDQKEEAGVETLAKAIAGKL